MGRLIDADALLTVLSKYEDNDDFKCDYEEGLQQRLQTCIDEINALPPVDAVEVIRCKDCLHNRACEIQYHAQAWDLFFCGAAERKDGNDD